MMRKWGRVQSMLDHLSFRLRSVDFIKGSWDARIKQQLVFSYALIIMKSGRTELVLGNQRYELDRHSVCLCMPDETFGTVASDNDFELFVFHFDVFMYLDKNQNSMKMTKESKLFPKKRMIIYPSEHLSAMCTKLCQRWNSEERMKEFRCQIDFQEILYYIYQNNSVKAENSSEALHVVKQYIEEHFSESLTIDQLAKMAEISPKYFVDLFKKKYGISAMEYVADLRLKEAKRLLANMDVRVRDIAHQVGYSDEFYFSRRFKKAIGVSPTIYMKKRRRKLIVYHPQLLGYLLPLNIVPYAAPLHPKWTEYYYQHYRNEIPIHLKAYRQNYYWQDNIQLLQQISGEQIIAMEDISEEEKQLLETIAPVFYLPSSYKNWREQFVLLADFLGETWQANQWLKEYDQKVRTVRKQLQQSIANESIVVIRMLHQNMYLYCNHGVANILYKDLALTPAHMNRKGIYNDAVTVKELHTLKADHLLMLICQDSETLHEWRKMKISNEWKSIRAVERCKVHDITSDPWREYSAYAHLRMLNEVPRILSENYPSSFWI